jgi:uncharacterized protein
MNQYLVAFITGLTTGGLSCLAVQGGLLASSLERQMEQNLLNQPASAGKKRGKKVVARPRAWLALPIGLFLGAKIAAYTILGFLLGALGSVLKLNATFRAVMLILIGIFMVGNALRMFNVHPFFRYFVIEPPKFITRYIRKTAKSDELFTPIFLGALTVLIPCGVTQAMLAVALATSDPWQAAGLMLAFTLGTSPVFFVVSYLATSLGSRWEAAFMRVVAVVILFLGVVSIDSGFTLMGAPSVMGWAQGLMTPQVADTAPAQPASGNQLLLSVKNDGYWPRRLHAQAGTPVQLALVTKETYSCSRGFVIPALNVEQLLPATGTEYVDIPPQPAGTILPFTCSMGMYTGEIVFDQ